MNRCLEHSSKQSVFIFGHYWKCIIITIKKCNVNVVRLTRLYIEWIAFFFSGIHYKYIIIPPTHCLFSHKNKGNQCLPTYFEPRHTFYIGKIPWHTTKQNVTQSICNEIKLPSFLIHLQFSYSVWNLSLFSWTQVAGIILANTEIIFNIYGWNKSWHFN